MEVSNRRRGGLCVVAGVDGADHAACRAPVLSGDPGDQGRAAPVRRLRAAHLQHRAVRHGLRHPGVWLAFRSLRPTPGSAVGSGAVPDRQCAVGDGADAVYAGARAADPGDWGWLRAHAGAGDCARRLPRRAAHQGDRLSDHVRHARAHGVAVHRRRAHRHARLAQRVRVRAGGRRQHYHGRRLPDDRRDSSGRQPQDQRRERAAQLHHPVPAVALHVVRFADGPQHRRLHGDGDIIGHPDGRPAAPSTPPSSASTFSVSGGLS